MNPHGCGEPGIMYLDSANFMSYNQPSPFVMYGDRVVKQSELLLDKPGTAIHFGNRAGRGIPELSEVLGRVAKGTARKPEPVNGRSHQWIFPVIGLDEPKQYVGIEKARNAQGRSS